MKNISIKVIVSFILVPFITSSIINPGISFAQESFVLPPAGTMIGMSSNQLQPIIRGIKVNPQNPFDLDFIIDQGKTPLPTQDLKDETRRMVKYFLAVLTIPQGDLWVNLSPYEKSHITTADLGITELGRDMLAQDYLLKQLSASLTYPQTELGKKFWGEIYRKVQGIYGNTQVKVDTFNKVWIVPQKVVVYQKGNTIFIVDAHLRAMMEEDYTALVKNQKTASTRHALASEVMRNIVLPQVEKEVNEGSNFARLRQIYNAFIMAIWYKRNLKNSILSNIYFNQKKTTGVDVQDKAVGEKIYQQYLRAFKKGVYNLIQEDPDTGSGQIIPHKYFSGGVDLTTDPSAAMVSTELVPREAVDGHVLSDAAVRLQGVSAAMTAQAYRDSLNKSMDLLGRREYGQGAEILKTAIIEYYEKALQGVGELNDAKALYIAGRKLGAYSKKLSQQLITHIEDDEVVREYLDQLKILAASKQGIRILAAVQQLDKFNALKSAATEKDQEAQYALDREIYEGVKAEIEGRVSQLEDRTSEQNRKKTELEATFDRNNARLASLSKRKREITANLQGGIRTLIEQIDKMILSTERDQERLGVEIAAVDTVLGEIQDAINVANEELRVAQAELVGKLEENGRKQQGQEQKIVLFNKRIETKEAFIREMIGKISKKIGKEVQEVPPAAEEIEPSAAARSATAVPEVGVRMERIGPAKRVAKKQGPLDNINTPLALADFVEAKLRAVWADEMRTKKGRRDKERQIGIYRRLILSSKEVNPKIFEGLTKILGLKSKVFLEKIDEFKQSSQERVATGSLEPITPKEGEKETLSNTYTFKALGDFIVSQTEQKFGPDLLAFAIKIGFADERALRGYFEHGTIGIFRRDRDKIASWANQVGIVPDILGKRIEMINEYASIGQDISVLNKIPDIVTNRWELGQFLMKRRLQLGYQYRSIVAAAVGVTAPAITFYEQGKSFPRVDKKDKKKHLELYAEKLNIAPEALRRKIIEVTGKALKAGIAGEFTVEEVKAAIITVEESGGTPDIGNITEAIAQDSLVTPIEVEERMTELGITQPVDIDRIAKEKKKEDAFRELLTAVLDDDIKNRYIAASIEKLTPWQDLLNFVINQILIDLDVQHTPEYEGISDDRLVEMVKERLVEMGYETNAQLEDLRKSLLKIDLPSTEIRSWIIDLELGNGKTNPASSEEFYNELVELMVLRTGKTASLVREHLKTELGIGIENFKEIRKLEDERVDARLKKIDRDKVILLIMQAGDEIPDNVLQEHVIQELVKEFPNLTGSQIEKHLASLGYAGQEDFIKARDQFRVTQRRPENGQDRMSNPQRYEFLRTSLNAQLASLKGFSENEIEDVDHLQKILESELFRKLMEPDTVVILRTKRDISLLSTQDLEHILNNLKLNRKWMKGLNETPTTMQLTLAVLYLLARDRGGQMRSILSSLYHKYAVGIAQFQTEAQANAHTKAGAKKADYLPEDVRFYLENIWLVSRENPKTLRRLLRKGHANRSELAVMFKNYNRTHTRREDEEIKINAAYNAIMNGTPYFRQLGSTKVQQAQLERFLGEKTKSPAMTTPGGIDLNENMMDISARGDANALINVNGDITKNIHIDGLSPVILKFTPITNLYLFLGANEAAFNSPSV